MLQEIITYLIVLLAVYLAVTKIVKKLRRKKRTAVAKTKNELLTMGHNCSDCSAECMLRDATKPYIQANKNLCNKVEIKTKSSDEL